MYFREASFKVGQGIDGLGLFSHWEDQGAKVLREQFLRMVEASYSFSVSFFFFFDILHMGRWDPRPHLLNLGMFVTLGQ